MKSAAKMRGKIRGLKHAGSAFLPSHWKNERMVKMRKVKFHVPCTGNGGKIILCERFGYCDGNFYYHKDGKLWVATDIQSGRILEKATTRKRLVELVNDPDYYMTRKFAALRMEVRYQNMCKQYSELLRKHGVEQ